MRRKYLQGMLVTTALFVTLGSGQVHAASSYTVQAGDSLYNIAQRFGTSVAQLTTVNGLDSGKWIYPGQVLSVGEGTPIIQPITTGSNYVVQSGDSLYLIAQRFGTSVAHLQAINGLSSSLIDVGQVLVVGSSPAPTKPPATQDLSTITVRQGDTLYLIGQRVGISVNDLMTTNGLNGSMIYPGQVLKINSSMPKPTPEPQPSSTPLMTNTGVTLLPGEWIKPTGNRSFDIIMIPDPANMTQAQLDVYWLSRIIEAEAGAEPYEGKVAVGNVILNRVKSPQFPNSIKGVIFDDYQGIPQFSPTLDGSLRHTPSSDSIRAAQDALNGARPMGESLYFLNPGKAGVTWIQQNRTFLSSIGLHDFYL